MYKKNEQLLKADDFKSRIAIEHEVIAHLENTHFFQWIYVCVCVVAKFKTKISFEYNNRHFKQNPESLEIILLTINDNGEVCGNGNHI